MKERMNNTPAGKQRLTWEERQYLQVAKIPQSRGNRLSGAPTSDILSGAAATAHTSKTGRPPSKNCRVAKRELRGRNAQNHRGLEPERGGMS
jgi:hypothetical protein